jgi:hypothetical protein
MLQLRLLGLLLLLQVLLLLARLYPGQELERQRQ